MRAVMESTYAVVGAALLRAKPGVPCRAVPCATWAVQWHVGPPATHRTHAACRPPCSPDITCTFPSHHGAGRQPEPPSSSLISPHSPYHQVPTPSHRPTKPRSQAHLPQMALKRSTLCSWGPKRVALGRMSCCPAPGPAPAPAPASIAAWYSRAMASITLPAMALATLGQHHTYIYWSVCASCRRQVSCVGWEGEGAGGYATEEVSPAVHRHAAGPLM